MGLQMLKYADSLVIFKRGVNGKPLSSVGSEYYDGGVPFEGVYVNYIKKILEVSIPCQFSTDQ